jgi:hypothetical protein
VLVALKQDGLAGRGKVKCPNNNKIESPQWRKNSTVCSWPFSDHLV